MHLSAGISKILFFAEVVNYTIDRNGKQGSICRDYLRYYNGTEYIILCIRDNTCCTYLSCSADTSVCQIDYGILFGILYQYMLFKFGPFAIGKAGDYTFYDNDGDETFGLDGGVMFENQGQPMSYIVFDIEGIDEAGQSSVAGLAHSGSKCLASFSSASKANDDWLISPELPGIKQTISFWHRSADVRYGFDQFEILYSTTGNAPADFIKLGDTYASGLGWAKIEAQLPEGSKYFAIHCISYQTEAWLIDDISYTRGTPNYTVIGYNIYRDGVKINDAVVTENQYVDNLTEDGDYSYNVTALYAEGESGLSNAYDASTTGIDDMRADGISIRTDKGVIIVDGASDVAVYGIDGKIHGIGHDNTVIAVEPGFYVVKADGKVATVSVR